MVEPKDISELKYLHWGESEEYHTLGRREADMLVERDEVQHLFITEDIPIDLMQEALDRQKLVHVVEARVLYTLADILRQTLVELIEALVCDLSASQPLYDPAFQCCRLALA